MWRDVELGSVSIGWYDKQIELTSTSGEKVYLPLDTEMAVEMIGFPEKVSYTLKAPELAEYMNEGYAIIKIGFEE